ncbi:MAG: Ig-like domain-containing protein [Actinobacteria bacterium]|nr:Ig-like domain-containing protein [Actinomycetota bacterium]
MAASGFQSRSTVRLVMYSTPIDLGQTTSSATGSISQEVQIPTSAPSGRHTITAIGVDASGETYVASIGVVIDNDGPEIRSITVSQNTVAPGDTFTISIDANDPSAIAMVGFWFIINGGQRDFCGQNTTRTSGTAENGTWTYNCTVPASVIGGTYTITPYASDSLQNWTNSNCCSSSTARATFTVA